MQSAEDTSPVSQKRQVLTIEEVARHLGICRTSAYNLARRDQLPAPVIRVGRRLYIGATAWDQAMSKSHPVSDRADLAS